MIERVASTIGGSSNQNKYEFICINRQFKCANKTKSNKDHVFESLDDVVSMDAPCLISANAGYGKTMLRFQTVKDWAESKVLRKLTLLIGITARSFLKDTKMPIEEMIFNFTTLAVCHKKIAYEELSKLGRKHKLGYFIDGLDELSNLTTAQLQKIRENVIKSEKDPQYEITGVDFIGGLIAGIIHRGSIIIGTGRPTTIQSIASKLLNEKCIVYELLEFNKANVHSLVHKWTCGELSSCVKEPEEMCKKIIMAIEENPRIEEISHTPVLCASMVRFLIRKLEENQQIDVGNINIATIQLNALMMNIIRQYNQEVGSSAFTDWAGTEIGKGIYNLCWLCYESLRDGVIQIQGERVKIDKEDFFKSTYIKVSLDILEKTEIFRIVYNKVGAIVVEASHLSNHEFFGSTIYCTEEEVEANKHLEMMDLERQVAFMINAAYLVTGDDPYQTNFIQFLEMMSGKKVDKKIIVAQIYKHIANMPSTILPEVEDVRKLNFTMTSVGKRILGMTFGDINLRTSQVHIMSKIAKITEVPCDINIDQTAHEWILDMPKEVEKASNLLRFLDIQGVPPGTVKMPSWISNGLTTVIRDYVASHPVINVIFPGWCRFDLTRPSDFPSLVYLCQSLLLKIQHIFWVYCMQICGAEHVMEISELLLKIKHVYILGNQRDEMWRQLAAGLTRNSSISILWMANFTTTAETIEYIITCVLYVITVFLDRLSASKYHWEKIAAALQTSADKTSKIKSLRLYDIEIHRNNSRVRLGDVC